MEKGACTTRRNFSWKIPIPKKLVKSAATTAGFCKLKIDEVSQEPARNFPDVFIRIIFLLYHNISSVIILIINTITITITIAVIIMIVIIIIIIIIIIINQRETLLVLCGLVALAQGERAEPDIKITRWNKRPANYSHLVILKVKVKKPNILKGRVRVEQQACKSWRYW